MKMIENIVEPPEYKYIFPQNKKDICDIYNKHNDVSITDISPKDNKCINITFTYNMTIPKKATIIKAYPKSRQEIISIQDMVLCLDTNKATLSIPIFYGILKCFYPDSESYYYIEKEGIFVPSITQKQLESGNMLFYIKYHDKLCFHLLPSGKINILDPFWKDFVILQLSSLM